MDERLMEMDEQELLIELVKNQRSAAFHQRLASIFGGIFIILFIAVSVILVPKAAGTLNRINDAAAETKLMAEEARLAAEDARTALGKADTLLEDLSVLSGSISGMEESLEDISTAVEDTTASLGGSIEKLGGIDVDSLNKSIKELADIMSPLSGFFSR